MIILKQIGEFFGEGVSQGRIQGGVLGIPPPF